MNAAKHENIENLQTLLASGANVQDRDSGGRTSLMYATGSYSDATINMLLNAGSEVNAKDNDGATALMHAAKEINNTDIVRVLLDRGAAVNARDGRGRAPLWYALQP